MSWAKAALALATLLPGAPAAAQIVVDGGVEASTDERRRGLSWSAGRAAVSADVAAEAAGVRASARMASMRGSARHGGADAVVDLTLSTRRSVGPIEMEARARAHLFAGARGSLDYGELGAAAFYSLGPLSLDAGIDYAPRQSAIGGSVFYLSAGASAGLPGTPVTLSAAAGRSSGHTDDPVRAARLRPEAHYHDWRFGVDYVQGPLTLGLDYVGTDVRRRTNIGAFADARHAGDTLLGRARLSF